MTELVEETKIIYNNLTRSCLKQLAETLPTQSWRYGQMKFSVNKCKIMHGGGKEIILFLLRG